MKTRKLILYFLFAVLCGVIGGTLHQIRKTAALRAEKADCIRKTCSLREALDKAQADDKALQQILHSAGTQLQKLPNPAVTAKATAAGSIATGIAAAEANQSPFQLGPVRDAELIATNSEYKKLWMAYQRWSDRLSFARLYTKLGLTPTQILSFEELLLQKSQTAVDIAESALEQGVSMDTANYHKLATPGYLEMEAKIKEFLGEEGFKEYKIQCSNLGGQETRATIQAMVNGLFYSETPLRVEQADRLARIIDSSYMETGNGKAINWTKVYDTAQRVLTPEQIDLLRRVQITTQREKQMAALATNIARKQQ